LDRLSLLCPEGSVDERTINDAVLDSARFNVFEFTAELMAGRTLHAQRILAVLEQEGENPLGILAILSRDLRVVQALQLHMARSLPSAQFIKKQGLRPPQRARQIEQAARRLPPRALEQALATCQEVDRAAKGLSPLPPWHHLASLVNLLTPA